MKPASRTNYASPSPWEEVVGYSRAVRVGNIIEISGTVATDEAGHIIGKGDAYEQTRYIYQKIEAVLKRAGAGLKDVVRVRMFVTDIRQWQAYGRAHSEFFKEIKPCNSMLEVKGLIDADCMVEIEATAIATGT